MDSYANLRSLSFPAVALAVGLDATKFKLKGKDWCGACPIHGSKNNVGCFRYEVDGGRWHCFSCGVKGRGGIDLAMKLRSIGFKQAVELLSAAPAVVEPPKEKSPTEGNSEPLKPFTGQYHKYAVVCPWLESRCPDAAVRERYGVLFYQNDKRKSNVNRHVLIPVKDIEGVQYGWLARNIGEPTADQPKYRWPANVPKSKFVFGAYELAEKPVKVCYLVESPFTVLKFCTLGLHTLALYGWSVSPEQVELLAKVAKGCIVLPDKNKRQDVGPSLHLLAQRLWVRLPDYPAEDPEALTLQQIQSL